MGFTNLRIGASDKPALHVDELRTALTLILVAP
jgi:hypothetical protein